MVIKVEPYMNLNMEVRQPPTKNSCSVACVDDTSERIRNSTHKLRRSNALEEVKLKRKNNGRK